MKKALIFLILSSLNFKAYAANPESELCEKNQKKVNKRELREMINKGEDVTKLCISAIKKLTNLFKDKRDFNQDISGWDVSNVTNMSFMFDFAESAVPNVTNFKTDKVRDEFYVL